MSDQKPKGFKIDGEKAVAEMLNAMDEENRARLLKSLAERDPHLVDRIKKKMFVFDDLTRLSPVDFQIVLREVPQPILALALRNAAQAVRDFVHANLSSRAAALLEEEIATSGPRRISEIEAAQTEVLKIVQRLSAEGKIQFRG